MAELVLLQDFISFSQFPLAGTYFKEPLVSSALWVPEVGKLCWVEGDRLWPAIYHHYQKFGWSVGQAQYDVTMM